MHLRRNKLGAQYLKITLNSLDTYDLEWSKAINRKDKDKPWIIHTTIKVLQEDTNIYDDMLVSVFEQTTGLYTKLF